MAADKILGNCADVFFTPHGKIDNHIFGALTLLQNDGSKLNLVDELAQKRVGLTKVNDVIPNGIEHSMRNMKRYEKMGRLFVSNKSAQHPTINVIVQHNFDDEENPAISWCEMNRYMNQQVETKIHSSFDEVVRKLVDLKVSTPKRNEIISFEDKVNIHRSRALLSPSPEEFQPPKETCSPFKRIFEMMKDKKKEEVKEAKYGIKFLLIPSGCEDNLSEFLDSAQ